MILQPGQRGSNGRCGSHRKPYQPKRKRRKPEPTLTAKGGRIIRSLDEAAALIGATS